MNIVARIYFYNLHNGNTLKMKQIIIIISFLSILHSCKDSNVPKNNKEVEIKTQDNPSSDVDMPNSKTKEVEIKTQNILYSDVDMPNSKAKEEIIHTENEENNEALFSKFRSDLESKKFAIEQSDMNEKHGGSYSNCEKNLILNIKGQGIRWYYIKRKEAKPKNYYPDFSLRVYEFKNENEAKLNFDKINLALKSNGRFCNGKSPIVIVRNRNEVFELSTRAEMFRGYIKDFANKLENY